MSIMKLIILAVFNVVIACHSYAAQTAIRNLINDENIKCQTGTDDMACVKMRAMEFIDTILNKDNYNVSNFEVHANGHHPHGSQQTSGEQRSIDKLHLMDIMENYLSGHDISVKLPLVDSKVTVSSRNLAKDEFDVNIRLLNDIDNDDDGDADDDDDSDVIEGKSKKNKLFKKVKKHRLRKMALPIMVLILLKAITIIPMAIGILKVKALNALGLGFFSFIISVGLAIFQLCKKIAAEHHSTHISAHGPWDGRSLKPITSIGETKENPESHYLAYNGYQA